MKKKTNVGGYDRIKIGSNIRKWRSIKDIKQKDLASAIKLSEAAISNMENNLTDITMSQLEDIAITLEIELDQLFKDPQETINEKKYTTLENEGSQTRVMDKELVYALIGSIQKKDEQLKSVIDNVMHNMNKISNSNHAVSI
ncbi:MAG: helix-turn-helix transcriptional regulator [Bacteroidota bacterium]